MDYKIKYTDALEGIRELYNSDCDMIRVKRLRRQLEHIFPELKESKDEKIKREIVAYINELADLKNEKIPTKWLDWLEKQGQKETTWNKEDEEMLKWLCRIIHTQRLDKAITLKEESELGEWIDKWLNYTQPKQCEHLENNDNDEKIRKTLIDLVKCNERSGYKLLNNISTDSMITWLEKQGFNEEQTNLSYFTLDDVLALQCCMETVKKVQEDKELYEKLNDLHSKVYDTYQLEKQGEQPINKVESTFKVGDWVVTDYGRVSRVVSVDKYGDGYTLDDGVYFSGSWCNMYHHWTINDAKDGDVLATENFIFIFKNIDDGNGVHYYCQYEISKHENDNQFDIALPQSLMGRVGNSISHYSPATKEQRDLLFAKMKEAGYEWNAENKELKKVEHKTLNANEVVE